MKFFLYFFIIFIFIGCAEKQPIVSKGATIVFKTPFMKYYDKGFITKYDDHINLQMFNTGKLVLDMDIYKNKVCKSTLECLSSKEFNKQYLHDSYEGQFLYELFSKEKIYHKDKLNGILIKVK